MLDLKKGFDETIQNIVALIKDLLRIALKFTKIWLIIYAIACD